MRRCLGVLSPAGVLVVLALKVAAAPAVPDTGLLAETVFSPGQRYAMVVAHRGGGFFAPENTLAAIDLAAEVGCQGVELDVARTADGQFVLLHDETVDRTTNGSGAVAEMTLAQVRELEIRWTPQKFIRKFQFPVPPDSPRFRGLRVPTLEEALDRAQGKLFVALDLKQDDAESVARIVADKGLLRDVIIKANSLPEGRAVRAVAPEAVLMARGENEMDTWEMLRELQTPIVHLDEQTFAPAFIADVTQAGALIWMNTIGKDDVQAVVADGTDLYWRRRLGDLVMDAVPAQFRPHVRVYCRLVDSGADLIQTDNIVQVAKTMSTYAKPVPHRPPH